MLIKGQKLQKHTPGETVRMGLCYISEDRRRDGLFLEHTVIDNTAIASISKYAKGINIDDATLSRVSEEVNGRLSTKYASPSMKVEALSGGNQQKILFARWLMADAGIYILDEPTRGIDIGAKDEIYEIIETLVKEGKSVIIISSESGELRRICDRILVMCEGRITGELDAEQADDETILQYASAAATPVNE